MLRNNPALKFCDIDDVTEESTHGSALFEYPKICEVESSLQI